MRASAHRDPVFGDRILEEPPCPRCGVDEAEFIMKGRDYLHGLAFEASIAECAHCGLWFQRPRLAIECHEELYPKEYVPHQLLGQITPRIHPWTLAYLRRNRGYHHLPSIPGALPAILSAWPASTLMNWRSGVALVPKYVPGGRVLDVGCGSGGHLRVLAELGWGDRHGIELSKPAAAAAAASGAHVLQGPVEALLASYPDAHFDAIVCSMVVEHLCHPFDMVGQMLRKLRPGGEFLLSTVCRDTPEQRWFGEYWAAFDFPRHMVIFRREDIRELVGSEIESLEWFPQIAPIDIVRSASWRSRGIDRLLVKAGVRGSMVLSTVLAMSGRSSRISLRCRRKTRGLA